MVVQLGSIQLGKVFTNFLISALAVVRVEALVIEIGHLFQMRIASLKQVLCIMDLMPGTISFPWVQVLVLMFSSTNCCFLVLVDNFQHLMLS